VPEIVLLAACIGSIGGPEVKGKMIGGEVTARHTKPQQTAERSVSLSASGQVWPIKQSETEPPIINSRVKDSKNYPVFFDTRSVKNSVKCSSVMKICGWTCDHHS
jgi:hypothetical protein